MRSRLCILILAALCLMRPSDSQVRSPQPARTSKGTERRVIVPERVAKLVRPLLDWRQRSRRQSEVSESDFERLLLKLTARKDAASDEALVVVMCFYFGESQEDTDAVIARGHRMLKYLKKYRYATPSVPGRAYTNSLLKNPSLKADEFTGAIRAIQKGWHSTADNPEG